MADMSDMSTVTKEVSLSREGDVLWTTTPYNPHFVDVAKHLRGKWDPERRQWWFPADRERGVRHLITTAFGVELQDFTEPGKDGKVTTLVLVEEKPRGKRRKKEYPTAAGKTEEPVMTEVERAYLLARDLATLMPLLDESQHEVVYEIIFVRSPVEIEKPFIS